MPLLAITPGHHILTGDPRLCQRPMAPIIESLHQMGLRVECSENEGFLPVHIQGGIPTKRTVQVDPLLSSQFVSALMLIAPVLPEGISLTMTSRPTSRPYVEMTADILRQAGVNVRRSSNGRTYYVQPLTTKTKPTAITIERDWSSASYFYTMALLRPELRIRLLGLQLDTCQGDSAADEFFRQLGVRSTEVRSPYRAAGRSITLQGGFEHNKTVQFNCLDCPDLVPTFAVAAAVAGVRATLKGVSNIALKESDRMYAISTELRRMGGKVDTTAEEMVIIPAPLKPVEPVKTYGDHRIAMAFAPLRLVFPDLQIENPRERTMPFLYTILGFSFWCYFLSAVLHAPLYIIYVAVGATVTIALIALINMRWKISAHLTGFGGLVGGIMSYCLGIGAIPTWGTLALWLGLSLVLMYARVRLQAHTPAQVCAGWLLGITCTFIPYCIYSYAA